MYINLDETSCLEKAIHESEDLECSICLEDIKDKYTIIKCNHVFHKQCLNLWLKKHQTCPMCRTYLKEYYEGYVYNKKTFKLGLKFYLIVTEDSLIIKYYYKYTNIFKKKIVVPLKNIKYFSYSGQYVSYDFYDTEKKSITKNILQLKHNSAESLFTTMKSRVTVLSRLLRRTVSNISFV